MLLLIKKLKTTRFIILINLINDVILNLGLKNIFRRERPLDIMLVKETGYSFPSGHTLTSIVFYMLLWYIVTKNTNNFIKIVYFSSFVILAILIGFSRIYLGVHFFSDVMGGLLFAIPCTLMCINIINKNFINKLN